MERGIRSVSIELVRPTLQLRQDIFLQGQRYTMVMLCQFLIMPARVTVYRAMAARALLYPGT